MDSIIGHLEIISQLTKMSKSNKLSHALLFNGIKSIGKKTTALKLAEQLLTEDTKYLVQSGNHPDLHFIFPEENKKDISVTEIRTLITKLQYKSYYSGRTITIIDEAHRMSSSACNAFLKTLEEPNPNTHIILISSAMHKLPQTIISRCQLFNFRELSKDNLLLILRNLLIAIDIKDEDINNLADLCQGSLFFLNLEKFIDIKTSKIINSKSLKKHLSNILDKYFFYKDKFSTLENKTCNPLSLATNLSSAKEKNSHELMWHYLFVFLRAKLRKQNSNSLLQTSWADILLKANEANELVNQRNANLCLHLSSLFLDIHRIAKQNIKAQ